MKSSDKRILLIVAGVVALGALWFGLISPKRSQLGELDGQVSELQAQVTQAEQTAASAQSAKDTYESDYRQLITLGKAVPADDDSSSLIDQIDGLAADAGVDFLGLELAQGAGGAAAPAQPAAPTPPADAASTESSDQTDPSGENAAASATETTTAAPATETAAADLPLGATVGPAGLPVMPYTLTFRGSFFDVADFMAALDGMVQTGRNGVTVDGRLLTVDSFDLHPDEAGSGALSVELHVTSYVAPADQGATGGASPTTPAPATGAPVAATTPTDTAAPTAAVTPPAP